MLPTSAARRTALSALAVVSALGLAACSGGSPDPAGAAAPSAEAAATVATAPSAETSSGASGPSPAPGPPNADEAPAAGGAEDRPAPDPTTGAEGPEVQDGAAAGGGLCAASQLDLAVVPAGAGTGSVFLDLTATNASGVPCTIAGYPGVSFVDARGTMIGAPAVRTPAAPGTPQVLAPGQSATATLRTARASMFPACDPRPAAGLRVYPPESTEPVVVPYLVQACTNPTVQQLETQGFGT